jgi:hypothetical protein
LERVVVVVSVACGGLPPHRMAANGGDIKPAKQDLPGRVDYGAGKFDRAAISPSRHTGLSADLRTLGQRRGTQ